MIPAIPIRSTPLIEEARTGTDQPDDPEALIEEARQRTRRRRRTYATATAVLVLIGVSLFIVFGRSGPSLSASSGLPTPAGAANQDEAATVIAHDVRMHWAWVLAYADGRVIWQFDGLTGVSGSQLFERHLTPEGVDLVRSGAIPPSTLLDEASVSSCAPGKAVCPSNLSVLPAPRNPSAVPAGTWADSEISTYEPSRWAIDALSEAEIARFPAAAQALLRGAERATYKNVFLLYPDEPPPSWTRSVEVFELTTAEVRALYAALIETGIPEVNAAQAAIIDGRTPFVPPDLISPEGQTLRPYPILPHGETIAFFG